MVHAEPDEVALGFRVLLALLAQALFVTARQLAAAAQDGEAPSDSAAATGNA